MAELHRAAMRFLLLACTLSISVVACGGGKGASSAVASSDPLPIAAFQLVDTKDGHPAVQVRADGSIVDDKGQVGGKIDGHALLIKGDDGTFKALWSVDADGTVHSPLATGEARLNFDAEGVLHVLKDGVTGTITLGDDGTLTLVHGDKTESLPIKVTGDFPNCRRGAILLSMSLAYKKD